MGRTITRTPLVETRVVPWEGVRVARVDYAKNGLRSGAGDGRVYVAETLADHYVDAHDLILVAVPAGLGHHAAAAILRNVPTAIAGVPGDAEAA